MINGNDICISCGAYIVEGEGTTCKNCLKNGGPVKITKNLHIENSYNIWNKTTMFNMITEESNKKYGIYLADLLLNRSYTSIYTEWYLHNIGYWATLPFIKNKTIKSLNERFKHVDIEEHE